MRCPRCGTELPDGAKFCAACGANLTDLGGDSQTAAYPPTQVTPVSVPAQIPYQEDAYASGAAQDVTRTMRREMPQDEDADDPDDEDEPSGKRKGRKGKKSKKKEPKKQGRAGLIITIILLILALAALGYFGWNYIQQQNTRIDDLQQQVQDLTDEQKKAESDSKQEGSSSETDTANTGSTETSTVDDSGSVTSDYSSGSALEGTWTGDMTETSSWSGKNCYGATDHPIVINIEKVGSNNQITLTCKVLYHGHDSYDLSSDVASSEGDAYLESGELTSTLQSNGSFEFSFEPDGSSTKVEVKVEPMGTDSSSQTRYQVEVDSDFDDVSYQFVDKYEITKSSDSAQ